MFVLAMQPSLEVKKKLCSIFFLKKKEKKKEKNTVWGSINKKKSYKMMSTFSLIYKRRQVRLGWRLSLLLLPGPRPGIKEGLSAAGT